MDRPQTDQQIREQQDVEKVLDRFITKSWPSLAPFAWKNFREHGIGAIVVDHRKPWHVTYRSLRDLSHEDKALARLVIQGRSYDPKKSIIGVFLPNTSLFETDPEPVVKVYSLEPPPDSFQTADELAAFDRDLEQAGVYLQGLLEQIEKELATRGRG